MEVVRANAAGVAAALDAPIASDAMMMKVGKWFGLGWANAGATKPDGDTRGGRITIGRACTLDAIACEVVTLAGGTGALVRLSIYNDDNGLPGTLLLDAGTVVAETLGLKQIAIAQALARGSYWLVASLQGAATPTPTLRTASSVASVASRSGFGGVDFRFAPNSFGTITGTMPGTLTGPAAGDVDYGVWIKASA